MKCKNCKRTIEDNSLYCNWCGAKQIREKDVIHIPEPRKTANGYTAQIMVDGQRIRVTARTKAEYQKRATEIKKGQLPGKQPPTLSKCIEEYINNNSETLSPSTLRGYDQIKRCRFQRYMDKDISTIDYQKMINEEAKDKSAKTIKNGWGLVASSLRYAEYKVPTVNLPKVPEPETDFLDHKQIKKFLKAIENTDIEIPALLGLHSLRASEMYRLEAGDIKNGVIHVHGATVKDKNNQWVDKETNKNRKSTRDIPVIIPRLEKIIPKAGRIVTTKQQYTRVKLAAICKDNKLPVCSLHDLRRTFATLAAYLGWREETICAVGGWETGSPIVHSVYVKVSDAAIKEDIKTMRAYLKKP